MRLLLSVLSLVIGFTILGVSLTTSPTVVLSAGGQEQASNRRIYLSKQVLPDHLAYPVLMALDRVRLEAASPTERVYLQVEYGQRRLDYVKALLEKNNSSLALTTATKAQKYLIYSAQEALDHNMSSTVKQHVLKSLEYQTKEVVALKPKFVADQDRAVLDQLITEAHVLQNRLQSSTTASTSN